MQKKIKILHIQQQINSGGVERRRLSLAKYLNKDRFEQMFLCTLAIGNIPKEIRAEGHEVVALGVLKSPFHIEIHKKVQQIIEEYQPDIIHGAVFEGVTLAAINGWLKKVPIIIIEETSDPQNRSWKANTLMKLFSKLSHKVVGVSQAVTDDYLIGKLNLSPNKVCTITNGVALPQLVNTEEIADLKETFGINDNDFVIGSVGRMVDDGHKKFSILIKAFANFAKNKTNVKLLLVGNGPEMSNYVRLVDVLGVKNNVIFAGYQADVTLYYKMMDVFALVSAREAFGLVLAEAMLNKLPVIATKVGGMKSIVDHQQTGLLVEVGDVRAIQASMEKIYTDEVVRQKFSQNAYNKAIIEYTEEKYVERVENLYNSCVNFLFNIKSIRY